MSGRVQARSNWQLKRSRHGQGGSTAHRLSDVQKNVASAQLESRFLGKKPHAVSHGHKLNICEKVAAGIAPEKRHLLIDYRNGNKVLLIRMMTKLKAWEKNQKLKGSGRAWALCQG